MNQEIPEIVRGLYLVPPHGTMLIRGEKKAVLKSVRFNMAGEWLAIIEDQQLLGVAQFHDPIPIPRDQVLDYANIHRVSSEELDKWWPDANVLFMYFVKDVRPYPVPIPFDTPPGVQTFIEQVKLPNVELLEKSVQARIRIIGVKGNIDREGNNASILLEVNGEKIRFDKGSASRVKADVVVITHIHPDHIGALEKTDVVYAPPPAYKALAEAGFNVIEMPFRKPTKINGISITPYPVLHSTRAPAAALRVDGDSFSFVYAPDILGWESRDDRDACLEGASFAFFDASHPNGITRRDAQGNLWGHASWSAEASWAQKAGVPKIYLIHFGEFYYDSPEEALVLAKEIGAKHGVDIQFTNEGQEIDVLAKLHLEEFMTTGMDYDLEHPAERWRQLLADARYLGNSAYPRLKAGEKWGDWTLDLALRYFGKIIDTLRSVYFPLVPPKPTDPQYNSSYWEAYREAEKRGYIKSKPPSEEEIKEWDKKRAEIIKDALFALWSALPNEVLIQPDWASITGSLIYGQHPPHDVDVIIRLNASPGALLKIQRAIQSEVNLPVQFSLDPNGPTWDYLPIYELVARKVPFELRVVREGEEARRLLYKAKLITDPEKFDPDKPFVHYDVAGEFYIPQEAELAWEKWARRAVEKGEVIVLQPKGDGIRFIFARGKKVHVFTEKGDDVVRNFPGIERLAKKIAPSFALDCEFVEFDPNYEYQISRTQMTWMATAKQPKEDFHIKIFVHDIAWLNGKNVTQLPYTERLKILQDLIPKPIKLGRYILQVFETKIVKDRESFLKAIEDFRQVEKGRSTEGVMAKLGSFRYDPQEARTAVIKLKNRVELDCLILGYRRMPKPRPAGVTWTKEEAFKNLEWTDTYICRLGLLDEKTGKIVPIEAKKKLTEKDLKLDWDEDKQAWTGLDDPNVWTMFFGIPNRGPGEYAFGNSYATKFSSPPKPGTILTVAPMEITTFEDEKGDIHVSWQHPIPVSIKDPGSRIGTIQAAFFAHRKEPPEEFATLIDIKG